MVSCEMRSEQRRLKVVELKVKVQHMREERRNLQGEVARLNAKLATIESNGPPSATPPPASSDIEAALVKLARSKNTRRLCLAFHPDKVAKADKRAATLLFRFVQRNRLDVDE